MDVPWNYRNGVDKRWTRMNLRSALESPDKADDRAGYPDQPDEPVMEPVLVPAEANRMISNDPPCESPSRGLFMRSCVPGAPL